MGSQFYRTIDRLAQALADGDTAEARRQLDIAMRLHRGPYELASLRHWSERVDDAEATSASATCTPGCRVDATPPRAREHTTRGCGSGPRSRRTSSAGSPSWPQQLAGWSGGSRSAAGAVRAGCNLEAASLRRRRRR